MANIPEKIERIAAEGYEFRFGDYLSKGINTAQADLGAFGGYTLLYFLIRGFSQLVPIIGPLASAIIDPALTTGFYVYAHAIETDQPREFNLFFNGFQRLGDLFLAALLRGLVVFSCVLPGLVVFLYGITNGFEVGFLDSDLDGAEPNISLSIVGALLMLAPGFYLVVAYSLSPLFVWFYRMSAWESMVASKKIVDRQWWLFAAFFLVCGLLTISGVLLICIGMLFTIPAAQSALYAAFADVTRLNEDITPDDNLIDHFAPLN